MSSDTVGNHLQVLGESIRLLQELSTQAKEMAQQLQDVHSREARGVRGCMLKEEPVMSLKDQIVGIRNELNNAAELIPKIETPLEVPWIGEKRDQLRLVYLGGDDPWEFYLGYNNDDEQQRVQETVKEKISEGLLEKRTPKVGEFVVCHQLIQGRHEYFRALVTKYYPRLKKGVHVYKLDTGVRTAVFLDDVYDVPMDIAFIPIRVIKCCLDVGEHQLKETFGAELRLVFKDALEKCILTVDVLDKTNDSDKAEPPCFSTVVWLFDETRCGTDVNLNHWVATTVIPRLKDMPPGCSDMFTEIQGFDILDPFHVYETERETGVAADDGDHMLNVKPAHDHIQDSATASPTVPEYPKPIQEDCVTSTAVKFDQPDPERIAASLEKVNEWINGGSYAHNVKLPTPEPVVEPTFVFRKRAVKNDQKPHPPAQVRLSKFETPVEPINDSARSPIVDTRSDQPPPQKPARLSKYKKHGDPQRGSPPSKEDEESEVASIKHSQFSPSAPEFVPRSDSIPIFEPKCLVQITTNGNEDDDYDGVITNLQEEYQPTDEKRVCLFYQKNGYCGRKLCTREHTKKASVWTTDTISIYGRTFNDIDLPTVCSEVPLKIQHVKGPLSFYVNLPESYSDIGEPGVLETSKTLHYDLNSLESNNTHPLLPVGPQIAELVIALGYQDSLGPRKKWLRARILRVLDETHVEVFFLDFGNRQVVKTKDLRQMRPQFLHLPAQAVLTTLYNLKPNPEKIEVALKFLKDSIEGKELIATIMSRFDGDLEVLLFMENGDCFNEILVQQNLANVVIT